MKVVLVTNIPTPYRIPLWDALYNLIDLQVICISEIEKNRHWHTENRNYISFLKSHHFFMKDRSFHFSLPLALFIKLIKINPDVLIITGYDLPQYWEALFYAKIFGKKKVLWSGSTLLSALSKSNIMYRLKKYFIHSCDGYYTYGSEATKYIESFGVDSDKIVTGVNTVDTDYYKTHASNFFRVDGKLNFLFVGQLIKRKGLENVIEAFAKISRDDWRLMVVGKGEQENDLKQLTAKYGLENHIEFMGFKQKEQIVEYYAKADVFLMPSYKEVWGLVLNEALASGLFCIASKYAGATFDLIKEGENGFIIDPMNIEDVVRKIEETFKLTLDKQSIRNNFNVSYTKEAKKILKTIKKVLV